MYNKSNIKQTECKIISYNYYDLFHKLYCVINRYEDLLSMYGTTFSDKEKELIFNLTVDLGNKIEIIKKIEQVSITKIEYDKLLEEDKKLKEELGLL